MFISKPANVTFCDDSLIKQRLSLFQVAQSDLLGNPHSWLVPFPAVLLWKNNAYYP